MAIIVTKQPDVHVSASELRRYQDEYRKFIGHYCGTPPTFEDFVRSQQAAERRMRDE